MPDIDAKKIEELLPCPFCGGAAQAEHFESKLGRWRWSIGCNDHTSKADDGGEPAAECYGFQSMTSFATKAEAIAAWNRRASHSLASASGEDGKLLRVIDETLQAMASQASVPMDLWDKHSNSVLTLMARIRSLSAEVVEWRTESHSANDRAFANAAERDTLSAQLAEARRERDEAREATNNIKYRLKNRIDLWLNDHLVEMREGYDDSIVGFNEAWDIIRSVFADGESNNAGK